MVRYLKFILFLVVSSCATLKPLPAHLRVSDASALLEKIERDSGEVKGFVAEVRLTYFRDGQRLKGTGTIACMVPGFLRYEILGPHGGPIEAFTMDGSEFQIAKLVENRFLYGPATPELLDELLPIAPLNLKPEDWVNLFRGVVTIPRGAGLNYDATVGRFKLEYERENLSMEVEVDPETNKITRIRAASEGVTLYEVVISMWDSKSGAPLDFSINSPPSKIQLRLRFREIESVYPIPKENFRLEVPRGTRPEYIGL